MTTSTIDRPAAASPAVAPRLRTLGILGGMSWESTLVYYRLINQAVARRLGGLHSAPLLMHSLDFESVARLQRAGDWDGAASMLADCARGLAGAGAQALLVATNTMHKVADPIREAGGLPLLHIGDACGRALAAAGRRHVGLLGTRFTMEQDFLHRHLQRFGVQTLSPAADDRDVVHRIIFEELCRGVLRDESRAAYLAVIERLAERGCDAVILACTEIGLLLPPDAGSALPMFDSTALHAHAAAAWACGDPFPEDPDR
jgi:aspartate racemase